MKLILFLFMFEILKFEKLNTKAELVQDPSRIDSILNDINSILFKMQSHNDLLTKKIEDYEFKISDLIKKKIDKSIRLNETLEYLNLNLSDRFQASLLLNKEIDFYLNELKRYNKTVEDLEIQIRNLQSKSNGEEKNREGFLYDDEKIVDCSSIKGNGIIQIEIETKLNHKPIMLNVQCENKWIVIQQRLNGFETSFNRTWNEYINGFNSLGHDFWLGLEFIHVLTQQNQQTELLIELTDWHDQIFLAHYDNFKLGPIDDFYRLHLSPNFNGNASKDYIDDSYFGLSSQNGTPFSTYDKINAEKHYKNFKNCPSRSGGGWWFNNFSNCLPVNLNAIYVSGASAPSAKGIKWQAIRPLDRNYALKKSKMKIRHKQN